jgi:hypothetical protein
LRIPLFILVAIVILCIAISPRSHSQAPRHERPPASTRPDEKQPSFDECDALADLISDLPAWKETGTLSADEWRTLARTASALQPLGTGNMALVLVKYMKKYGEGLPDQMDDPDPRTKPLLLLAAMFDLSRPTTNDLNALYADRNTRGVQICGGFYYHQISRKNLPDLERFAFPLSWTDEGPKLTAVRVARVVGQRGGPPHERYEPWAEFHHFVRFYAHRRSFAPYLTEDVPTWRELIAERNARQAATQPHVR